MKRTAYGLLGVAALLLLVVASLYFVGSSNVNRTYEAQVAALVIPDDSASISDGRHLTRIFGCADCHGQDLSGMVIVDEPPFRVTAPNLTPAGPIAGYSFAEIDAAIRHGIGPDGEALLVMPSSVYNNLADDDVASMIAYLRTVEPVENDLPPTEFRMLGRLMASTVINPAFEVRTGPARSEPAPARGPTAVYGEYLASAFCTHCHGGDLRGNDRPPTPGSPPAPDLAIAAAWPLNQFIETMRTGVTPGGHQMEPHFMPWTATAEMTDDELEALYRFIGSLDQGV